MWSLGVQNNKQDCRIKACEISGPWTVKSTVAVMPGVCVCPKSFPACLTL